MYKVEKSGGKKEEVMAQRRGMKLWVIAGQDWTEAPERFGHGSDKEKSQKEEGGFELH